MHLPFLQACRGKNEEFKLCNINRCIKGTHSRISICVKVFEVEMFGRSSARASSTWPPPGELREKSQAESNFVQKYFHLHSLWLMIINHINVES